MSHTEKADDVDPQLPGAQVGRHGRLELSSEHRTLITESPRPTCYYFYFTYIL